MLKYLGNPFRWLTIAGLIVIVVLLRLHLSNPAAPTPAQSPELAPAPSPVNQASNQAQPRGALPPPVAKTVPASPAQGDAFARTLAMVHLKLRLWMETQTGDRASRDRLENELLAMLTDENAAPILRALSPEEMDTPFALSALFHWMKTDPMTAANWVAARPDATDSQAWVVAQNLIAGGADLASYGGQLPDTGWKQMLLANGCLDVITQNPSEAVNLAQQMDPGHEQTNLLQTVASDWISNDPDKALDWILSVNDPSLREQLTAAAAKAYATDNPALAAEWLISSVKSQDILDSTLPSIMGIWEAKDPAAVADWEAQFINGNAP